MKIKSPAKLNLHLEVLKKRKDGFHEIRTAFQLIDFNDEIEFKLTNNEISLIETPFPIKENSVLKAAYLLKKITRTSKGVTISLNKRIPMEKGLGGGSSNAATTLVALNKLWNTQLKQKKLMEIGLELGSDVPFFLQGGTALGEGKGELITQLPDLPPLELLLICPNQTIPNKTATLYSQLNASNFSDGGITNSMVGSLLTGQLPTDIIHNVFESIAFQTFPTLSNIFQVVQMSVNASPHLCGSGPGIFCFPSNKTEFDQLRYYLKNSDCVVYLTNCIESTAVQCQSNNSLTD